MPDAATRREVLPHGLRLVTERMPHVRSVSIGVWLTRGSRHEPRQHEGIAHFVEHMDFNGTRRFQKQALVDYIEAIGMRFGADPTSTVANAFALWSSHRAYMVLVWKAPVLMYAVPTAAPKRSRPLLLALKVVKLALSYLNVKPMLVIADWASSPDTPRLVAPTMGSSAPVAGVNT